MITAASINNEPEKQDNCIASEAPITTENIDKTSLTKPIASIFTKEGRQKLRENAFATKSRNGRKKQPESSSGPTMSAEYNPKDIGKPRKPRKTPESKTVASSGKPKRKKKVDKDEDSDYRDSQLTIRSRIVKLKVRTVDGTATDNTSVTSEYSSEGGSASTEELFPDTIIDPNHSRRKRRKRANSREKSQVSVRRKEKNHAKDTEISGISPIVGDPSVASTVPIVISTSQETCGTDSTAKKNDDERPAEEQSANEVKPKENNPLQAKAIHPFFALSGLKKVASKPIHPFFAQGGMKKMSSFLPGPKLPVRSTNMDIIDFGPPKCQITTPPKESDFCVAENAAKFDRSLFLSPTSNRILKLPGLIDAPWPDKEQMHVRGLLSGEIDSLHMSLPLVTKKLKEASVGVSGREDLLTHLVVDLQIEAYQDRINRPTYYQEEHYRLSSTLHVPERMIMTGPELQEEVRMRTAARLPHPDNSLLRAQRETSTSSDDSMVDSTRDKLHPAIRRLYADLHDGLTPFDSGDYETQLWTAKFAPETSEEVLQVGREMSILRDWLLRLMVESGGDASRKRKKRSAKGKDGGGSAKHKLRKKKRRRRNKGDGLDDFLVESDEDQDEMDEITDPEDTEGWSSSRNFYGLCTKRSTIRTGDKLASEAEESGFNSMVGSSALGGGQGGRMVNAVVISGPSGCGKTASVHAVAYEMGYTVFEVGPGMRRNGRDLLDQVGEMSKNHLVHNSKRNPTASSASYVKSKNNVEEVIKRAQQHDDKAQGQSLILLEEVDLLYEEDKQFWQTVTMLMGQSRRPIVMTCNDESVIPFDILSLHAILRLTPPPEDLTVDYLLLLAANEGHLLMRDTVQGLYHAVKGDLRAAIMELNFWCQMGVGDRRAGLDWILQRFPKGIDLNEKGELKRVISDNTYITGLGWLPKGEDDGVTKNSNVTQDDLWRAMWDSWKIDVGADGTDIARGMDAWAAEVSEKEHVMKHMALDAYQFHVESLSAVDVYAKRGMRPEDDPLLDTTKPKLSAYVRNDDLQGYQLVQTHLLSSPHCMDTLMSTTIRCLARHYLASETNSLLSNPMEHGICPYSRDALVSAICHREEISLTTRPIHSSFIASALTPISLPTSGAPTAKDSNTFGTTHSIIHNPTAIITTDIAPYVRSIIRHYQHKDQERTKASSLFSFNDGKRRRATRSSMLALEGGDRGSGRRGTEKYFARGNLKDILATGGSNWGEYVEDVLGGMISDASMAEGSSQEGSDRYYEVQASSSSP